MFFLVQIIKYFMVSCVAVQVLMHLGKTVLQLAFEEVVLGFGFADVLLPKFYPFVSYTSS